ncbi:MAG: SDR family oxidoreductase [Bdellovibrionales bacterium]|nr:SDR family oxidoreductase [Ramlibacter sp.]
MSYRSVFKPGLFAGKVVIVTGGGSGIGRCTAHELAALGAHVVLIGRNLQKLQVVAGEIAADGTVEHPGRPGHVGHVSFHACDIRQEDAVRNTITAIVIAHGRVDGLVNNAGGQYITPAEQISAKGWDAVVATNLTGGFLMARECYVQSMQKHGGSIVNIIADIWGSMPGMAHSGAARAGMVSFTETAAAEWAKSGVRVNAVAPGYIASSGMDHYPPEAAAMLRGMRETVPLGRFGNEAETSAAVAFLLSPAAAFISGSVLRVDGARPQVRMGWGQVAASAEVQQREAIKAFDGFHRYVTPKVFADLDGGDDSTEAAS